MFVLRDIKVKLYPYANGKFHHGGMGEFVGLAVDGEEKSLQLREIEFHANSLIQKSFLIMQTCVFMHVEP
jgi:hypothetical protein